MKRMCNKLFSVNHFTLIKCLGFIKCVEEGNTMKYGGIFTKHDSKDLIITEK